MWMGKRIRNAKLGEDDNGAVNCVSNPRDMCVPKKGASLGMESEIVDIVFARLNWTLCYICRPISPPSSELSYPMPAIRRSILDIYPIPSLKFKKVMNNTRIYAIH